MDAMRKQYEPQIKGDTEYIPVVDPTQIDQKGVFSYPNPQSLRAGQWAYAENARYDKESILPRKANRPLGAGAGTQPTGYASDWQLRGHVVVTPNDNTLQLVAWRNSAGVVQVFNLSQAGVWTEITDATSRWTDTGNWLYATTFSDLQSGTDFVVFGAAGVTPRVWNGSTLSTAMIANAVALPKDSNIYQSVAGFTASFPVATPGSTTFTNSDAANWAGADAGSGSDLYVAFSRSTAASASPTSLVTFPAPVDASNARQVMFYVQPDTNIGNWLEYVKIEIYDGANYFTVHDPTSTFNRATEVEGLVSGDYVWACPLDAPPSGFVMTSVDGFRFTFVGTAPTSAAVLNLLACAFGGQVTGGSLYVVSYFNPTTRVESAGQVVNIGTGQRLDQNGGGEWGGRRWPVSPVLYYQMTVAYKDTSSAENTAGVTRVRLYRADASLDVEGNPQYEAQASYVKAINFTTADTAQTTTDNLVSSSRITELVCPSAFCQSPPNSIAMIGANGRVFALGATSASDNSNRYNSLWVSEFGNGMRFQEVLAYGWQSISDDRAATRSTLEGDVGRGFSALATADIGVLTVFPFGRNAVYVLPGTDAVSLSSPKIANLVGTNQPLSISVWKNELFWLGTDNQVYRGSASTSNAISWSTVEDQIPTYDLTNIWGAFGVCGQGYYYLALSSSTSASLPKTKALVYEIVDDIWCGVDIAPSGRNLDSLVSFRSDLIYGVSSVSGTAFRHDGGSSTTDLNNSNAEAAIQVTLHSPSFVGSQDFSTGLGLKRIEIVSDDVDLTAGAGAFVGTPTYVPDGTSPNSVTINMNTTGIKAWRVGTMTNALSNAPNQGYAMQVRITAQMLSGKEISRIRFGVVRRNLEPSSL